MGIRIDAHAVDVAAFERLLDRPLWRVLRDLSDPALGPFGEDGDVLFNVSDRAAKGHYHILPDRRVLYWGHPAPGVIVPRDTLPDVPLLGQSTRTYLSDPDGSALSLMFLLRDLPVLDGRKYAHEITSGHKGWWITSAMAAARAGTLLPPPALDELSGFFARVLRGYDFGAGLTPHAQGPAPGDFPVIRDEPDCRTAVFNEAECYRFVGLLDQLMERRPTFVAPDDPRPGEDPDWTDYVGGMINKFRSIPNFRLPNLRLVTFIG